MKKIIASVVLAMFSLTASADDWIAPLLGGMILGNVFSGPRVHTQSYYYAPPPPPATIVYNDYHYNTYVPPAYIYRIPQYRTQQVWDPYCGCYRSMTYYNY